MASSLLALTSYFGADDPLIQQILADKGLWDRASELVSKTKLSQVQVRKKLYQENAASLQASADPMISLARAIDPVARESRKKYV